MLEFIQLLKQRYQALLAQQVDEAGRQRCVQRIDQLHLTEAFIRKGELTQVKNQPVLQIAIIGPTQVGKSSVVNVLLNSDMAGVSPLAGYTVHAQGFCHLVNKADNQSLQRFFGRFQCLEVSALPKHRFDCYALTDVAGHSPYLPACVLWDTPDFDSIDSQTYREGVLRTIALADVVILVVSKEKYADQSVWDMMALLEDLHQPTFICLNKISEGSEDILLRSLQEKWRQVRSDAYPETILLSYQKLGGLPIWPEINRSLLTRLSVNINARKHNQYELSLVQKYSPGWLEPVNEELQALSEWQQLIDGLVKQALQSYQREFLDHPQHYETFQQALAELLTLLEIPGLAGLLTGARKVLVWPIKQLMKYAKKPAHLADTSQEVVLLNRLAEHLLIQLQDNILDNAERTKTGFWSKEFSSLVRSIRGDLLTEFSLAARNYHIEFQRDVEKTAHQLYDKLQEQPVVLNSLRATRVTADAAVIALTLHTGGIGVHDLVIAPAMLTVTSLLTESAIGGFIHKLEMQLKQQQLHHVKQKLFIEHMAKKLLSLPERIPATMHFNISTEQLKAFEQQLAEKHLTEKRHGLRIL